MQSYKTITVILVASIFIMLAGCSSAERRSAKAATKTYKSQTELNERKMKLVNQYQDCIKKSTTPEESESCDSYLRAAEGL